MIVPVIADVVNRSLLEGSVPSCLKKAIVMHLLKKVGLDQEKHYKELSSNIQLIIKSGYTAFHSTECALLQVHNDLLTAMDRKQGSYLVLLDLSAAFDNVNHGLLRHRLKARLGIGGTALV